MRQFDLPAQKARSTEGFNTSIEGTLPEKLKCTILYNTCNQAAFIVD
jgi:hypothetical protein